MKKIISSTLSFLLVIILSLNVCAEKKVATEGDLHDAFADISGFEEAGSVAAAAGTAESLQVKSKSYILMDIPSKTVIAEHDSDLQLAPASITKVMSLLLVMESIDEGRMTLDTEVTTSEHAASMGGSQIWLEPNEKMTVDDLLKAAVVASANDAMTALAEAVSGSEESFVEEMNSRAAELGLQNTHFVNCSGLDAEGHYFSARDIAVTSAELMKHDIIKNYSTIWMDSLRSGETELVNTNKLVRFYSGATGLKTGTTSTAGCCLSATAEKEGLGLVAVVMGCDTSADRFNSARKLLDYGFANYKSLTVTPDLSECALPKVKNGVTDQLQIESGNATYLVKKSGDEAEIEIVIKDEVQAPVKRGDKVGEVIVRLSGNELGAIPIVAKTDVARSNFGTHFVCLLKSLFGL